MVFNSFSFAAIKKEKFLVYRTIPGIFEKCKSVPECSVFPPFSLHHYTRRPAFAGVCRPAPSRPNGPPPPLVSPNHSSLAASPLNTRPGQLPRPPRHPSHSPAPPPAFHAQASLPGQLNLPRVSFPLPLCVAAYK